MKILTSEQIRSADAYTIKNEPIESVDLMERASEAFVRELLRIKNDCSHFTVFAGPGNNGGDGLVIARLLSRKGFSVHVCYVDFSENVSKDFEINKTRLMNTTVTFQSIRSIEDLTEIRQKSTVIDAIFGSGLTRPVKGFPGEVIDHINAADHYTVAVDIPSGLFHDNNADNDLKAVVKADLTISFQVPKLCFLLPEFSEFVGKWVIVNIGLDKSFIADLKTNFFTLERSDIQVNPRDSFAHKGTFGHALLCSGSLGKMGAAILSSRSCLRSGVGLLTTLVPSCGYSILQESVPEAMALTSDSENELSGVAPELTSYKAIGAGPGIGTKAPTHDFIKSLIMSSEAPLVLDADALNIISNDLSLLKYLQNRAILTPHPKEFDRIAGTSMNTYERIEKQIALSKEFNIVIILKGHHSSISTPEGNVFFNTTGNPGMSTAGSGDVLTGITLAFAAMGYSLTEAAKISVYLHGLAGDIALSEVGEASMIASDLIEHLPKAFAQLQH